MNCLCRFCQKPLSQTLVDLGETPLANSYVSADDVKSVVLEKRFPLRVMVCNSCWLVQTTETIPADGIFKQDYAYLSSYSSGWVAHAHRYANQMSKRFDLGPNSKVVEIASNDGYLLQHFVALHIPVLGIEPAGDAAALAEGIGVPTRVMFFDEASKH
ncbi:MAG: class I SAM-dependent methyltransferase [Pseudomonadales bacterium]